MAEIKSEAVLKCLCSLDIARKKTSAGIKAITSVYLAQLFGTKLVTIEIILADLVDRGLIKQVEQQVYDEFDNAISVVRGYVLTKLGKHTRAYKDSNRDELSRLRSMKEHIRKRA